MKDKMKAWKVSEKDECYSTVVFAETRGKARALARYTDTCEDCDFCDIRVYRVPKIDKYYKDGKIEMDWYISQDRIALVKELGFSCLDIDITECENCPAKEYCDSYKDEKDYWENDL